MKLHQNIYAFACDRGWPDMFDFIAAWADGEREKSSPLAAELGRVLCASFTGGVYKLNLNWTAKKDAELEALCIKVEEALKELGKPVTITEFMKESTHEVATLSNQKLTSIFGRCKDKRHTVKREEIKKKAYFSLVEEEA